MTEEIEVELSRHCCFCINTLCVAKGPIQLLNRTQSNCTHTHVECLGRNVFSDNNSEIKGVRKKTGTWRVTKD